jgi:hypothetical protein
LAERGAATVVTDPYQRQDRSAPLKLAADIVTTSQSPSDSFELEAVTGTPHLISGPGEYEVGGVFITGIRAGDQKPFDEEQAAHLVRRNTIFVFDYNGLTIAHLGHLNRVLTQSEVEAIGTVNVALIPIGATSGLTAARATEVISLLEPNIVIPIQLDLTPGDPSQDALNKFLKEMGLTEVNSQPSLKISSTALPEETKVFVLDYRNS